MLAGVALVVFAAVRVPSELKDTTRTSAATTTTVPEPVSDEPCVGGPCRANNDGRPARGYEVPSLAVDPDDPAHVVVGDMNLVGGACGWHVTFDGGRTWADGVFDVPAEFSRCALDSSGFLPMGNVGMGATGDTVYAVFAANRPDRGESTLVVKSTDGGRTFGPAREALAGPAANLAYVRPQLTVSTDGAGVDRLLVSVWGCAPRRCTQGFFFRSDDGGATFGPPVLVTPDPGGNSPSQPAIAPDGTVYMTYVRRYDTEDHDLLLARSTDGGRTFDSSQVDEQPGIGVQYDSVKVAVDPAGAAVYLVFADERDFRPEVFFRRSLDKGRTWEKTVRLHTSKGGRSYSPAVAVAPDGRIEVVFYKELGKDSLDVHATFSTDGGATFAPDVKLNDTPIDRSIGYWNEVGDDTIPAVAATPTSTYFAWSDTLYGDETTNTQEILARRVDRPAAA